MVGNKQIQQVLWMELTFSTKSSTVGVLVTKGLYWLVLVWQSHVINFVFPQKVVKRCLVSYTNADHLAPFVAKCLYIVMPSYQHVGFRHNGIDIKKPCIL